MRIGKCGMYKLIKKHNAHSLAAAREGTIPRCNFSGTLATLRLSDDSFLIMCGPCKQARLIAFPSLVKWQGKRKTEPVVKTRVVNESGL